MGKLNLEQREFLTSQFQERANFRRTERKLYGHDIAAIPRLLKPLTGNTVPDAVVQPQTEAELVRLVNWARTADTAYSRVKRLPAMGAFCP